MNCFYHNGGFLLDGLHVIPAEAVPVSEADHSALMQAQSEGCSIQPDATGRPAAIAPPLPNPDAVRKAEIAARLQEIDIATIRPQRAILAGTGTDEDQEKLKGLETEANALRDELRQLREPES